MENVVTKYVLFDDETEQKSITLTTLLKSIIGDTSELFYKSNILLDLLQGSIYKEAIDSINECNEALATTVPYFYEATLQANLDASEIACKINMFTTPEYTGWVDRMREVASIHKNIRQNILQIFMNYNEADFVQVFFYLKLRLAIHEKHLWILRGYIS